MDKQLEHVKDVKYDPFFSAIVKSTAKNDKRLETGHDQADKDAKAVDQKDWTETSVDLINALTSQAMHLLHPGDARRLRPLTRGNLLKNRRYAPGNHYVDHRTAQTVRGSQTNGYGCQNLSHIKPLI